MEETSPLITAVILIVDDETDLSFLIKEILKRAGAATICYSRMQILKDAPATKFDAAVIDLDTPSKDAELNSEILKVLSNLPVIALTGHGSASGISNHSFKNVHYLRKPFGRIDLIKAIQARKR